MPNDEPPRGGITFYGGGPPITFRERYFNDEDPDVSEQRPHLPQWAVLHQKSLPSPDAMIITSRAPGALVSRELAIAAARQRYLRRSAPGIEPGTEQDGTTHKLMPGSIKGKPVGNKPETEIRKLENRIKFLEAQLQSQSPHLQLYRLGAGSLFVSVISLVVWLLTGTGIPFHPIFATGVAPVSIGVIVMAFLVRPKKQNSK